MPKSLADGRVKLSVMDTKPANPLAPTVTELDAGLEASLRVLSSDYKLGAVASDTVDEKPIGQEGNVKVLTTSNYEGNLSIFRYFNTTTHVAEAGTGTTSDTVGDDVYQAMKAKGTRLWIAKRFTDKASSAAWAATDEVEVFEVVTDNSFDMEATGYIKRNVPISIEDAWLNGAVVSGP